MIAIVHMKPPLQSEDRFPIHAFGRADLQVGELRQIGVFIDEQASEYEADKIRRGHQYTILPHCKESDATCSVRRFSCAGFVIVAYSYAGIELVTTNTASLPVVSLEALIRAYPSFERNLKSTAERAKFGLIGDGPWPVILAGYIVNALNRSSEEIRREPYIPRVGDDYFLPRPENGESS
jgi:hypothetical protein